LFVMITLCLNLWQAGKRIIPILAARGRMLDAKRLTKPGLKPVTRHPHEKGGRIIISDTSSNHRKG